MAAVATPDLALVVHTYGLWIKLRSLFTPPNASKVSKALGRPQSQACSHRGVVNKTLLVLHTSGVLENPEVRGNGDNYRPPVCR